MMRLRPFVAIVSARLYAERWTIVSACAAAAAAGAVQQRGYLGPALFCSFAGIAIGLLQTPGRFVYLDVAEQSAPLFGRELARGKAAVPCAIVALVTAAYCSAGFAAGMEGSAMAFVIALASAIPGTLTALCATIRAGAPRVLYVLFACGVSAITYDFATQIQSLPGALLFAAAISFLALRQYGEALARYDPV